MLIKVYKNNMEQYINTKDIKKYYFALNDFSKSFYDIEIETYQKDKYTIISSATWNCCKYILLIISKQINENKALIEPYEIQNYYESNTFYMYYINNSGVFDDSDSEIMEKILDRSTEIEETENLKFIALASKILDSNEFEKIKNMYEKYKKEIENIDFELAGYLFYILI